MEVILKEDVKNLGYKDDLVKVRPGYGQNFLIPKGLAISATETAKKILAENKKQRAFKDEKIKKAANANAEQLKTMTVKVGAKAGENGKIFGSVNSVQIADAIKKLGIDIDRKNVTIKEENIKTLGTYTADVRLHKEVLVPISFEVIAE